jgi:hypothetical protein
MFHEKHKLFDLSPLESFEQDNTVGMSAECFMRNICRGLIAARNSWGGDEAW